MALDDRWFYDSLNLNNGLEFSMSRRRIGQETFGFVDGERKHLSLDDLAKLIDWAVVDQHLAGILLSFASE